MGLPAPKSRTTQSSLRGRVTKAAPEVEVSGKAGGAAFAQNAASSIPRRSRLQLATAASLGVSAVASPPPPRAETPPPVEAPAITPAASSRRRTRGVPTSPVFAASIPRAFHLAPLVSPADRSSAELCVWRLGELYCIRDAQGRGRGLFLCARGAQKGSFLARYGGVDRDTRTLPPASELPRTHMLRVPGSQQILDGRPVAEALVRARDGTGTWVPTDAAGAGEGYGSLANSASRLKANAKMVFVVDDLVEGVRPQGYNALSAPAKLHRDLANLLPRAAYLVALRPLQPLEEIVWHYQWRST